MLLASSLLIAGDDEPPPFHIHHEEVDAPIARALGDELEEARARIEEFFELPFTEAVEVTLHPDRDAFTAWFPEEWGMQETACWMVASGVADRMAILSPRVWEEQSCEHDPDDEEHLRGLVTHELVHVFRDQHNPTRDFTGAEEIGWFLEGLATYASGQLDEGHMAPASEAVAKGLGPERLQQAWSGKYRYGVCGTLARFLDQHAGRETLRRLLAVETEAQLLEEVGLTEEQLLEGWRASVTPEPAAPEGQGGRRPPGGRGLGKAARRPPVQGP